jgi:hypothetical protein
MVDIIFNVIQTFRIPCGIHSFSFHFIDLFADHILVLQSEQHRLQLLVSSTLILLPHFSVAYLVSTCKILVINSWWYNAFEAGEMLLLTLVLF